MEVYKNKASMAALNDLHNTVAKVISSELKRQAEGVILDAQNEEIEVEAVGVDVKLLSTAIAFLKNNNITVDAVEASEVVTIHDSIKQIAAKEDKDKFKGISVEDMIAVSQK